MSHTPTPEQIAAAVACLMCERDRHQDVIRWMQARDLGERNAAKPVRKRKQLLYTPRGERIELYRDVVKKLEKQ